MKYLYTLLCLLVGTAQAGQIPQTLTNLTNTVVQSSLVQGIKQNQALHKVSSVIAPTREDNLISLAGIGSFIVGAAAFLAWREVNHANGDPIAEATENMLAKIKIKEKNRKKISHILSALLFGLGTTALSSWQTQDPYLNAALNGVLTPIAIIASIARLDAIHFAFDAPFNFCFIANTILAPAAVYLGSKHRQYSIGMGEYLFAIYTFSTQ